MALALRMHQGNWTNNTAHQNYRDKSCSVRHRGRTRGNGERGLQSVSLLPLFAESGHPPSAHKNINIVSPAHTLDTHKDA